MKNILFDHSVFEVFTLQGLEPRMEKIRTKIRPTFESIEREIEPFLTMTLGQQVTTHIAKHARRTVNPPEETWIAWSTNKRGYKAHPHFQLGLRETHVFVWFALIYECEKKPLFAKNLKQQLDSIWPHIPSSYFISQDHTKPEATRISELNQNQIVERLTRLENVKKSEFLCGTIIPRQEALLLTKENWIQHIENTYQTLYPLYELAIQL
jgi:uncharacterized protein YktB (UPF0637 family)